VSQEFADCAAFFTVGAQCSKNTISGSDVLGAKSTEWAIKDMYLEGKIAQMSDLALQARLKFTMKAELNWIKNDRINIAVLLERFGDVCKPLLERPTDRHLELIAGGAPWVPVP
jgi:hypothetical protein